MMGVCSRCHEKYMRVIEERDSARAALAVETANANGLAHERDEALARAKWLATDAEQNSDLKADIARKDEALTRAVNVLADIGDSEGPDRSGAMPTCETYETWASNALPLIRSALAASAPGAMATTPAATSKADVADPHSPPAEAPSRAGVPSGSGDAEIDSPNFVSDAQRELQERGFVRVNRPGKGHRSRSAQAGGGEVTIKCSCSAGYNNGLDDAGAEAATVAAIVTWLRGAPDAIRGAIAAGLPSPGPLYDAGCIASLIHAAECIERGDWKPKGGA